MRRHLRLLATLTLAALSALPSALATGAASGRAPAIELAQGGRGLLWSVELGGAFSPGALQRAHRTLCLTIGGRPGTWRFCVISPARGRRAPRVARQTVLDGRPGPARVIAAVVTRSSSAQITVRLAGLAAALAPGTIRWQVSGPLLYPARPRRLRLHVPLAVGCVPAGASEVFGGPARREVALTFDDGPWGTPPTPAFLDMLERERVVATFFEIGRQIAPYDPGGRYERRMLADGDFIGNHTWSHPMMTHLSAAEQRSQLVSTEEAISQASGLETCLWRPPYGDVNGSLVSLARSLGLLTILWDVDPQDYNNPGTATIYTRVVGTTHDGSIILHHFGGGPRYETLAAVPHEIETLRARGYRFVTIPQMLGLRVIYR